MDQPPSAASTSSSAEGEPRWPLRAAAAGAAGLVGLCIAVGLHNVGPRRARWRRDITEDILGLSPDLVANHLVAMEVLLAAGFLLTASLILWRHRRDRGAVLIALMLATIGLTVSQLRDADRSQPWIGIGDGLQAIGTWALIVLYFVFPDGRFVPRWTRPLAWLWTVLIIAWCAFPQAPLNVLNADSFNRTLWLSTAFSIGWALLGLFAQWSRYRSIDDRLQKLQIKWVLLGFAVAWTSQTLFTVGLGVVKTLELPAIYRHGFRAIAYPLVVLGILSVPAAIGLAVERLRLFDIDRLIHRTLAYLIVSAVLGAAYLILVLWALTLLQQVPGNSRAPLAVAATTLLVAMAFRPLHRRAQRLVDLHLGAAESRSAVGLEEPLPQSLGAYRLAERLGAGGMATVFRARDPQCRSDVAVKVLRPRHQGPGHRGPQEAAARFRREAEIVSRLDHPAIVRLLDYGEEAGHLYLVMEHIDGPDLARVLEERGRCDLESVGAWITDIADALDHAHRHGVVHRDLKPANVMLRPPAAGSGERPRAVLTDFGLARLLDAGTQLTATQALGTVYYMSPEQIRFPARVGPASDIYALGAMTHHLLAGSPPFTGDTAGAVLMAHLRSPPPGLDETVPGLPRGVGAAVARALDKSRRRRFSTAAAFASALCGVEPVETEETGRTPS